MQTDKSNFLIKAGLALTATFSAGFTIYLFVDQFRKFKKQKEKSKIGHIERKIQSKLSQTKQETSLAQPKDVHQNTKSTYQSKKVNESFKFDLFKIVLTGGPCAGKTTAITYVSTKLRERGINVLVVPEFIMLIANGGGLLNIHNMSTQQIIKLQTVIMKGIMALEDHFVELAEISGGPTVILCDRGVMDAKAYMMADEWQVLLDENGYNLVNLRDKRYDAVIHLVTAADGAEEFYKLDNTKARYETSKEAAIDVDRKVRDAWIGHPYLVIADNHQKTFEQKIMKVFEAVLHVIGLPKAPKFYKKYLISKDQKLRDGIPYIPERYKTETVHMEDTFLKSNNPKIERKLRKRGSKDSYIYIYSTTVYNKSRESMTDEEFENDGIESKRQISAREYIVLSEESDKRRKTLEKIRQCFIYEEEYFFIDTFKNVPGRFSLLNIEANKDLASINMPSFISVERDVTDKLEYTSYSVALIPESSDSDT